MSQSIPGLILTAKAAGAVTACRGVTFGGVQVSVKGAKILGIAQTDAAVGDDLAVVTDGTVVVESGAAITEGDSLIMDLHGRAIPTTGPLTLATLAVADGAVAVKSTAENGSIITGGALSGGDPPEYLFGDALESATAAGQFIEVLLRR